MRAKSRIRKLIRPILDRNPDLVLVGHNTLWLLPIRHIGRHIHFQSYRDNYFILQWNLSALFVPALWVAPAIGSFYDLIGRSSLQTTHRDLNLPSRNPESLLYRCTPPFFNEGCGLWVYDDPAIQDDLIFQIEAILRLMRSLDTLEKCTAFLRPHSIYTPCQIEHWTMMLDLAVGDVDAARDHWLTVRHRHRRQSPEEPRGFFERIDHRWAELDEPLMSADRRALAALMGKWEAENIHSLKLQDIWDPYPFPFESRDPNSWIAEPK